MKLPTGRPAASRVPPELADWVERLHGVVDELVAPLALVNGARLNCRPGCHDCCADALSVFEIEAAVIERHYTELLATGVANVEGGCAFLDDHGQCRVYAHRPYVCRTQGLPLRWLEQDEHGVASEVRDVCPLNGEGPALEELSSDACWTLGPIEERLATRQAALDGGIGRRLPLRSLFTGVRVHLPIAR